MSYRECLSNYRRFGEGRPKLNQRRYEALRAEQEWLLFPGWEKPDEDDARRAEGGGGWNPRPTGYRTDDER